MNHLRCQSNAKGNETGGGSAATPSHPVSIAVKSTGQSDFNATLPINSPLDRRCFTHSAIGSATNENEIKNPAMDKPLFNLLNTSAPAATLVVRLLPGLVFFAEGIKKFMFPTERGIGRFEKIGIIYPPLSAPFVGVVETVCGLLLIFGLFTRQR